MEKYLPVLKQTHFFAGLVETEILSMLRCLQAKLCRYEKGAWVFRQGDTSSCVMLLLTGRLHIRQDDFWGNRSILGVVDAGGVFAEAYAAPGSGPFLTDVVAVEESRALAFDYKRILTPCAASCGFHAQVIQNLFFDLAGKNRSLVQKLGHMAKRSTRDKLAAYLSDEAKRQGCPGFSIPFNRQQLADYLAVDRSAMSKELCRMRDEGLLRFEKNRFVLLE